MDGGGGRAAGLSYLLCGAGPPVVLVPGLALDRWFWRPLWRRMPDFTLCSVDLPRVPGRSRPGPSAPPPRQGLAHLAQRLVAWHAAAGLPPCAWVGHSLGGQVCVHVAAAAHSPVTRLVLLAPSVPDSYAGYDARGMAADLLVEAPAFWWQVVRGLALRGPLGPIRAMRLAGSDRGLGDLMGRIAAPTLVLHGGRDVFIPAARLPAVAAAIPGAGSHVLPDAHHTLLYTHPGETASAIAAFLRAAGSGPGGRSGVPAPGL